MKDLLLLPPFRADDAAAFSHFPDCRVTFAELPSKEQLETAEIIFGQPDTETIARAPRLRWIQLTNAGIDYYTAHRNQLPDGLVITNLAGAFGQSVSECVLAYVLMFYKQLHLYRDSQSGACWQDEGVQDSPVNKNVLILGTGSIGTETARLLSFFRCRITGFRRNVTEIPPYFDRIVGRDGLDAALSQADIVIAALPASDKTNGLLNAGRLSLLKKSAFLINVGRGLTVDTAALTERLAAGLLAGAALDVTDPEPLPSDHPLWKMKNVILTPHITGGTFGHLKSTEERLFELCSENLKRYLGNEPLLNTVDLTSGCRTPQNRFSSKI